MSVLNVLLFLMPRRKKKELRSTLQFLFLQFLKPVNNTKVYSIFEEKTIDQKVENLYNLNVVYVQVFISCKLILKHLETFFES